MMLHLMLMITMTASAQAPIGPPDLGIVLCWDSAAEQQTARSRDLQLAVGRIIGLAGRAQTIGIRTESCEQNAPDAACFAANRIVLCRVGVLERTRRAASWLVAEYIASGVSDYEALRRRVNRGVVTAFQHADQPQADVEKRIAVSLATPSGGAMHAAVLEYALAALIGHELAHAYPDDACPIAEQSFTERQGLFARLVANEQKGEIFTAHNPSLAELRGDRCGLRFIYALAAKRELNVTAAQRDAVQRIAADIVAWHSATGWRRFTGLPQNRYAFVSLDTYLYAPFRAMLFAAEVRGTPTRPAICGYAAETIVTSVQETVTRYASGKGIIDDEILSWLPAGVEKAWNGGAWSADSYRCDDPSR